MNKTYCVREWLNDSESNATGSVVAFFGQSYYNDNPDVSMPFLEVADCHHKIRIHPIGKDLDYAKFVKKLRLLEKVIGEFADHLEKLE